MSAFVLSRSVIDWETGIWTWAAMVATVPLAPSDQEGLPVTSSASPSTIKVGMMMHPFLLGSP
jgi:hypothetical protein